MIALSNSFIAENPNALIKVTGELKISKLQAGDLSLYSKNYVFHHSGLIMNDCTLNPAEFAIICTLEVCNFHYIGYSEDNIPIAAYLKRMPKLEYLEYKVPYSIPNLALTLFEWKQQSKLRYLEIMCSRSSIQNLIDSPRLLAEFIRYQKLTFLMKLSYYDGIMEFSENFFNYFHEMQDYEIGKVHLIIDYIDNNDEIFSREFKLLNDIPTRRSNSETYKRCIIL